MAEGESGVPILVGVFILEKRSAALSGAIVVDKVSGGSDEAYEGGFYSKSDWLQVQFKIIGCQRLTIPNIEARGQLAK